MIVVMQANSSEEQLNTVLKAIEDSGYRPHLMRGEKRNVIGCLGDERGKDRLKTLEALPGVDNVMPILSPYKLAAKELQHTPSEIKISKNVTIGGTNIVVMAGPCLVENEKQIIESAHAVKAAGAQKLRGGG